MTDVLGGWAIGACWAAVVITGWIAVTRLGSPGGSADERVQGDE